jgi:N-acetylneuraminic acid mutarotase
MIMSKGISRVFVGTNRLAILLPIIAIFAISIAGCWGDDDGNVTGTGGGSAVASIDAPFNVLVGSWVTLDGSNSIGGEGRPITSYEWSLVLPLPTGSQAVIVDGDQAVATFLADVTGEFVVELIVRDSKTSDEATNSIHSRTSVPPVAVAEPADTTVDILTPAYLRGSGSYDPDPGDSYLGYFWEITDAPEGAVNLDALLDPRNSVRSTMTPEVPGEYEVQLRVRDQFALADFDTLYVHARRPENSAPVADAGNDTTVEAGDYVTLDGRNSYDPDNDFITFNWQFTSKPAGSGAIFLDPGADNQIFHADLEGEYRIELEVSDYEYSVQDEIIVTATPLPPEAWTRKMLFPALPRCYAASFSIGGKGYVGTGSDGSSGGCGGSSLGDFWEYTPAPGIDGGTWEQKASFPGGSRTRAAGFSADGKGYLGLSGINSDLYEYDPGLDSWRRMADFPGSNPSVTSGLAINGRGYVVGYGTNREFWQFDPLEGADGTWHRMADLTADPGTNSTSFVIGDKAYVFLDQSSNNFIIYDSISDAWTSPADYPGASVLPGRGKGFAIGTVGYVNDSMTRLYAYDSQTGVWTQKTSRPGLGLAGMGFSIGGKGYIGFTCASCVDLWEYDPLIDN